MLETPFELFSVVDTLYVLLCVHRPIKMAFSFNDHILHYRKTTKMIEFKLYFSFIKLIVLHVSFCMFYFVIHTKKLS